MVLALDSILLNAIAQSSVVNENGLGGRQTTPFITESTLGGGYSGRVSKTEHLVPRLGNDLALELGNDLTLELGNDLTLKLGNHLTPELGNHLALEASKLGNCGGP